MNGLIKTKDLCEILQTSRKVVLDRAKKENWPSIEKKGSLYWPENRLPMDIRFALVNRNSPDETAICTGQTYLNASDKARETATWRSSLIFAFRQSGLKKQDFIEAYNSGVIEQVIYKKLGQVSIATFYRWIKEFNDCGASGITPKYGMNRGGDGETLDETEKTLLRTFYLKSTQPSINHAYRLMRANVPFSTCTYQTARRYLLSIPPAIRDYYRLGKTRFENMHLPYMERDVNLFMSLDCVVSDHHCVDCVVKYKGKLIRPWITTFQDYRSGKVLGKCVCVKPSSLSIIVAYYEMVIRYGIPKTGIFDNGQDYRSKLLNGFTDHIKVLLPDGLTEEQEIEFQGLFSIIGTEIHFTRVYNGKSKGRQERYFRVIGEYLAKEMNSYVGSDSRTRPEESQLMYRAINGMAKRNDIPEFHDFVENAHAMIEYINNSFISTGIGMDGKTRSQVFEENLPETIRRATKEELQNALCIGAKRKCTRNGIKINSTNYWAPELIQYSGLDVIVRSSLVIDNEISVFSSSGNFICNAYGNYFKETGNTSEDIERLEKARKISLENLAITGTNEVTASPEFTTMIEVAKNQYSASSIESVDDYLALPKAAGGEAIYHESEAPMYPATKSRNNLIDPLLAENKDYI